MWHETARQRDRETERQRDRETERHSEVGYHGIVFVREKAFVRQVAMSHCPIFETARQRDKARSGVTS